MRPESSDSAARTELREMVVRLVHSSEQPRYQELMREHHYLGHLPKIGETLWYVASWREQWVALLSFSASALKCAARDRGTVYRAANWIYVGNTRGFRRTRLGYTATPASPKMVFLKLLRADARRLLCRAILSPPYHLGGTTMRLTAEQMRSLPCFFSQIPD